MALPLWKGTFPSFRVYDRSARSSTMVSLGSFPADYFAFFLPLITAFRQRLPAPQFSCYRTCLGKILLSCEVSQSALSCQPHFVRYLYGSSWTPCNTCFVLIGDLKPLKNPTPPKYTLIRSYLMHLPTDPIVRIFTVNIS